jgi:hypothetical protein
MTNGRSSSLWSEPREFYGAKQPSGDRDPLSPAPTADLNEALGCAKNLILRGNLIHRIFFLSERPNVPAPTADLNGAPGCAKHLILRGIL